ncbi:protein translocase subunit SecF [Thermoproteota archaeon]
MKFNFRFIEKKNLWFLLSICFIGAGLVTMGMRAVQSKPIMNFGIDFVGGTTILLKIEALDIQQTSQDTDFKSINLKFIEEIRAVISSFGLEKSTIQITQSREILIKTVQLNSQTSTKVIDALTRKFGPIEILEIDFIGPTIGEELRTISLWIILTVTVALLFYITWRFEFIFGIAALLALLHDALALTSFAALFNVEINTAYIAALLTILGYSINDTIVVFDRVRENLTKLKKRHGLTAIANISINQTLLRSINTSMTTLFVVGCLLLFGGTTIKPFTLILMVGVIAGTYSSIFIASPVLVMLFPKEKR